MSPQQLSEIVKAIAADGEETSFRKLYNHFFARLYELAFHYTRSNLLAEEVVSDVFVKIWRQRGRLTEIENIQAYLLTAVRHQSFDTLKKQKPQMLYIDQVEHELVASAAHPDQQLYTKEFLLFFARCVDELPEKARIVFKLLKEDGLKYRQAAQVLNLSEKSIEMYMSTALRQLRDRLSGFQRAADKRKA
jgi:RNA polymerase sigma-70 factor (ECF subfamily)